MLPNVEINIKCKIDEKSYKECVDKINELKALESDMKLNNNVNIAGEDLEYGDFVHMKSDGKMYKSDCIPATLKDVCEWWIKIYPDGVFYSGPRQIVEIRDHMKVILDRTS